MVAILDPHHTITTCAVCRTTIMDEKFMRDAKTGGPLYWRVQDPKVRNSEVIAYFCGPGCAQVFVPPELQEPSEE